MDVQVYANLLLEGLAYEEEDKMIQSLLTYCRQDTLAMLELAKWLIKQTED